MINDNRLKLTIPENQIESGAIEQIKNSLGYPCLKKLAIMPDVHSGYDLPIGAVALLDGYIWPGAVGYDIGCGLCHVNTKKTLDELPGLKDIYSRITNMVPVGFSVHSNSTKLFEKFPNASGYACLMDAVRYKASIQCGTLGGGNHFIEIGINKKRIVGITIHSGSRRPGWLIGDFYMRMSNGPVLLKSSAGSAYLKDMNWALKYALENRATMMRCCLLALGLGTGLMDKMVNENHNHAEVTSEGVLHRKGATSAKNGQIGIIPANMRDGVWITKGLGNEDFLSSASHGAGRSMSRTAAKKKISVDTLKMQMGNILSPNLESLTDEAPDAYKDINSVLRAQNGILVDIIDHFKPLLVIKG